MAKFIPEDKISEIKHSADIVDVISEFVILKKAGKNYLGLCPFHAEKAPSFTVSPDKQIFYCFGCSAGGNVFSFLMKYQRISFPEAAGLLAKRYGIDLPVHRMSPEQRSRISEKERLLDINQQAADFFCRALLRGGSQNKAMRYLEDRNLTKDIVDDFRLGYAAQGWDNLVQFFTTKNVPLSLVEKAGLIVARKNKNGFYDRFRDRIIFPILDLNMQVVGFGGRVMDDSMPKYLNSPETPVYNKRRTLYGLHRAKHHCRENNTVFIAEGYFDLLALHQHGIKNAVATLGTALTESQVQMIKGYAGRAVLVYDSDEAGINAAVRSVGMFLSAEMDARITLLPKGYDPDSFLNEYGHDAFLKTAGSAKSLMAFLMASAIATHGLSTDGKIRVISAMKAPLASIEDGLERSLYVKDLAERLDIEEGAILRKVAEITAKNRSRTKYGTWPKNKPHYRGQTSGGVKDKAGSDKGVKFERQIIAMMLQYPQILVEIDKRNILDYFEDGALRSIGQLILEQLLSANKTVSDLIDLVADSEHADIVASLAFGEELWSDERCLRIIERFECIRDKNEQMLLHKIKLAEQNNDMELLVKLLNERQKLAVRKEKKKMSLLRH